MKKIIINGATSMIGTALTEVAVREEVEVFAIIRPDTKRKGRIILSPLVHVIYGSLEQIDKVENLPSDCDVFYHLAWSGTAKATRDDPEIHEKNIRYTLDAVELAKRSGCHRFVGAGSQAEYGSVYERIDENTKFAPDISYGIAKYTAGIMSKKLCEKNSIEHVWGRVFSVYGPHDNDGTVIDYAIRCWENGEIAKFSSGQQLWNYLYETDAGEMFYRLGCDDVPAGAYFVANYESKVLKDYIEIMRNVYGTGAKAEYSNSKTTLVPGLNVDMERTMEMLHYKPHIDFEDGIKNMIDYKIAKIREGGVQPKIGFMQALFSDWRMAA